MMFIIKKINGMVFLLFENHFSPFSISLWIGTMIFLILFNFQTFVFLRLSSYQPKLASNCMFFFKDN